MMNSILLLFLSFLFLVNCSPTYTVKFDEPQPELITTKSLQHYLKEKDDIKLVLRTGDVSSDITKKESFNSIYNAIEKEFLRSGFVVRDRAIFNEVISKISGRTTYKILQEQTDTDLIIELVSIDTKVPYITNTYYDKGQQKTFRDDNSLTHYGARIEFRVVLLEKNQFTGSLLFDYAPCQDGCPIKTNRMGTPRLVNIDEEDDSEDTETDPYQYVHKDVFEEFVTNATKRLIKAMN